MLKGQGDHSEKVALIQAQMRSFYEEQKLQKNPSPISLQYQSNESNTTRSRSYKKGCRKLELGKLNEIIQIDTERKTALVEPRVTMEQLVKAALLYGLIPPVIPEFKGITVGGAIMGGAGESSSHKWGSFNDTCLSLEILCGNGTVLKASPQEHADLFYGMPCSYGSLGILLSAEIKLIPAKDLVHLHYHVCSSTRGAIELLQKFMHAAHPPDFLDGIVFSKDLAVVIEGSMRAKEEISSQVPRFSQKPINSDWYYQHVEKIAANSQAYEEIMSLQEYLFRYDQGAFWMGGYILRPQFLARYLFQGILKHTKLFQREFTNAEIEKFRFPPRLNAFWRTVLHPIVTTRSLWKLFHMADRWIQNQVIIQDFCIPEPNVGQYLGEVAQDPGTFPLWLCPIKSSHNPQLFAPHFAQNNSQTHVINVGIYGLPFYYTSIEQITKKLEQKTENFGGRKVLYSRSFYTPDQFWEIYPHQAYQALRAKVFATGIWNEITEKLLSE